MEAPRCRCEYPIGQEDIKLCPLHAAAPEMFEQAYALLEVFLDTNLGKDQDRAYYALKTTLTSITNACYNLDHGPQTSTEST